MDIHLAVKEVSLRTGLSHACVRELLEKDWMFIENFKETNYWKKVPWEERKARNAKP